MTARLATPLRGMGAARLQLSPACPTTAVQPRRPDLTPIVRILLAILLVGAAIALAAGWHWRSEKLALLQPAAGPLPPRPAPGSATGGVLLFGDSRVAQWRPLPVQYADYAIWQHDVFGSAGDPDSRIAAQLAGALSEALSRHGPSVVSVECSADEIPTFAPFLDTATQQTQKESSQHVAARA